ncbi:MAG: phytanoyl-CoA dioxygenase family protein [Polymorphobacter sp.]|uniref:phytanoyl-CoA dioxygenase family protein n=1 Tax=Polymorphobacter sp. TaxID=1909290 RepID=UPI003A88343C
MITPDHIAEYRGSGCTRIEGAFTDWVAPITAAIDRIEAGFAGDGWGHVTHSPVQNPPSRHPSGEGGVQLRNCMPCDPLFARWATESPAAALVGQLMGATSVRLWMDATFIKQGNDPAAATPWHNDVCTFPFTGEHLPSLWIALTDVDDANAPMLTLAGSNLDGWRYHSPLSRQDVSLEGYRPWAELEARVTAPDADIRVWPARAGDALLIHPKTIHASRPGSPGRRRVAFTTRWIGSDVVWAPDALSAVIAPLASHPAMRPGEAPPEAIFPVLWRG